MTSPVKNVTRAQRTINFIEKYCLAPDGMKVGQPIKLDPFQIKFFEDLLPESRAVRQAIWSMARKNAKTAAIAMLVLVFLVGPEARQNSELLSGAMSRDQAAKVFDYCCKMIRMSPALSGIIRIIESKKKLIGIPMNVTYQASAADSKTAQGSSPLVAIMDELGQVRGPRSEFFEAIETGQGAHDSPLLIIISTQASSDSDLLSIMIDDALLGADPTSICHLYTAPEGCGLLDKKAWKAANPALGSFRSEEDVKRLAEKAVRMPSQEPKFRNLILNQRIETMSPLIARESWKRCSGAPHPLSECVDIFGGLDLSGKTDLTALVLAGHHRATKTWNAHVWFWTPEKGLLERARRDRSPYDLWVKEGLIKTCPGATVDMEYVAADIVKICSGVDIVALAYDRWRIEILKKELEKIGGVLPLVEYGQGFKDMAPAIDAIEEKVLNASLRHGGNPVLTMCASNAVSTSDPAGNRKLDKRRITGRIDGMVSLTMAAGISERPFDIEGKLEDFINSPVSA